MKYEEFISVFFSICFIGLTLCGCSNNKQEYNPQSDFEFNNGVLVKYIGNSNSVIIPSTYIDSFNKVVDVKVIGDSAFKEKFFIETVKLPNSIESIEDNAFNYCFNFGSFNI